ncbi:MAG: hypothetical protein HY235_29360 [Acidobacteria bacterium]|nr:hypothetical protein [Acidobacteriota bacterium]
MTRSAPETEKPPISNQEVEAELEAVLSSRSFERSERLQKFLRFITGMTLRGEGNKINEYLIGIEVFQRGADYTPSEDSTVRRQAHSLRQKLQEYYAGEGSDHSIRIELPVGRYVPVCRRTPERRPAPSAPSAPKLERRSWIAAVLALTGGGLAGGWLLGRRSAGKPATPASVREIWGAWLPPKDEIVLCFSNPMTTVIKHFEKQLPSDAQPHRFRLAGEEEKVFRELFRLPPGGAIYYTPVINQGKLGEAMAAVNVTRFLTGYGVPVRATQSRFLSWETLRAGSYILLGHNEANPWIDPLLKKYPLRLEATSGERQRGILNTSPAAGEPSSWKINYSGGEKDADEEYALVSMIPGLENERPLLLISGLNAQATQIATEFLTNRAMLDLLCRKLKAAAPNHSGRWWFQAVLKTEVYDKVPTKATLITVRVL